MNSFFEYAEELQSLGCMQAALAEYQDLFDANLGGIEPLMRRSSILRELGLPSEAGAELVRAAEIEPGNGWPLLRLAQIAHSQDKPWSAAAYVQGALERQPDEPEIRINAAAIFRSLDWLDRAFDVVRPLPSDMADWWGDMRRDAQSAYRDEHAQTLAKLGQRSEVGVTRWELCLDLFRLGKLRVASRLCEALMRDDPASFAAFDFYAKIVARERGAAEAASFLRAIIFLHGHRLEHGEALSRMERQAGA